ncbi:MAG: DUF4340 domain-containing protein, partial [Clostridia bacterium]|nr:DUF4340 domain-containing protein [Clostridia bacterium]
NLYSSEAITAQDLTALTFYKDGAKVFVSKASTSATDWVLTFPLERKVDYNDFSKFLSWVASMRVSQYVEENAADLKVYGLDTPKYVFEYTLGGKNYVLKLGIQKDSKYYAQMEGNPAVFTLDASTLNFVDMPILDLIENFVYIPTIYDVEKLVINMDGRTDTLLINANKEDTTKDSYSINGKKVEGDDKQTLFKRYYQAAIAIAGDKIDLEAKPSGTAVISLTYTLKQANANGEKNMTVDLIPTPDGYGFCLMMNGKYTGMVMGNRQLDKEEMGLRQTYKNLMDALK